MGCAPVYTTSFVLRTYYPLEPSRGCCYCKQIASSLSLLYLARLMLSLARRWRQQFNPEQQYAMVKQNFARGAMEISLMSGLTIRMLLEWASVSQSPCSLFYPSSLLSVGLSYSRCQSRSIWYILRTGVLFEILNNNF